MLSAYTQHLCLGGGWAELKNGEAILERGVGGAV